MTASGAMRHAVLAVIALSVPCVAATGEQGPVQRFLLVNSAEAYGSYSASEPLDMQFAKKVFWGEMILLTSEQHRDRAWLRDEWFPVLTDVAEKRTWWIKAKFVVAEDELRRVERNWPIRYLNYDIGDYSPLYEFRADGQVRFRMGDEVSVGHVFLGPQVVQIRYPAPTFDTVALTAGYDSKAKKLHLVECGTDKTCARQGLFTDKRRPVLDSSGYCLLDCKAK